MPYTVKFDPNSVSLQSDIIPDANCHQDGVMPKALACKLINMPTGGVGVNQETVFVFRPGAVAPLASNVFNDWALLMAAVDAKQGLRTIEFDTSIVSPCVVPAGTWNMTDVVWSGGSLEPTFIHVDEGATFLRLRKLTKAAHVTFTGATPPVSDFGAVALDIFTIEGASQIGCSGTGPFIRNSAPGITVAVALENAGVLFTGSNPVVDIAVPGANGIVTGLTLGVAQDNTISGVVGANFTLLNMTTSAILSELQPAFLGSGNYQNISSPRTNPTAILTPPFSPFAATRDDVVQCDPTAGPLSVVLPPAFNLRGQGIIVKNSSVSANAITVTPTGGDTIDGGASAVISSSHGVLRFISDGGLNWMVV